MKAIEEGYLCHQYRFAERRRRLGCSRDHLHPDPHPRPGAHIWRVFATDVGLFYPSGTTPYLRPTAGADMGNRPPR